MYNLLSKYIHYDNGREITIFILLDFRPIKSVTNLLHSCFTKPRETNVDFDNTPILVYVRFSFNY